MAKRVAAPSPLVHIDIQIERWPIERLIPRANNPRTHSRAQVASIAASIKEFGFINPILVGADDDIIAGHARLLAAEKLGMKEVPVIPLGHLVAGPAPCARHRRQPVGHRGRRLGRGNAEGRTGDSSRGGLQPRPGRLR